MERTGVGSGFLDIFAHMDPEREKQFTVEKWWDDRKTIVSLSFPSNFLRGKLAVNWQVLNPQPVAHLLVI